jgi:hypothetical protein
MPTGASSFRMPWVGAPPRQRAQLPPLVKFRCLATAMNVANSGVPAARIASVPINQLARVAGAQNCQEPLKRRSPR